MSALAACTPILWAVRAIALKVDWLKVGSMSPWVTHPDFLQTNPSHSPLMAAPHSDPTIDDEWLPDADALATVLALLRRHRLTSVEHLLISELECRAEAATRAVAALSASSVSEAGDEHARAPAAVVSGDRCANPQRCSPDATPDTRHRFSPQQYSAA